MITVFLKTEYNTSLESLNRYNMMGHRSLFGKKRDLPTLFLQLLTDNPAYFKVQRDNFLGSNKIPPSRYSGGSNVFTHYEHRYWVILNLEPADLPDFYCEKKCLVDKPIDTEFSFDSKKSQNLYKYLHCFGIDLLHNEKNEWETVQTKAPRSAFTEISACMHGCTIS